jgi:tetratricopeptide (TPR) repeat protein
MARRAVLSTVLSLALMPCLASAMDPSVRRLVKDAERAYQGGKYLEAVAMLKQAYESQPDPRLLYNIAKAEDQAGNLKEALDYYQRYVNSSEGTDPKLLKRSSQAMDRVRSLLAKDDEERRRQEAERQRVEAEHQEAQADARAAQERATAEAAAARRAQEEAEAQNRANVEAQIGTRSRRRVVAWSAGGLGVAAVGAGAYFGVTANNAYNQFHSAQTIPDKDTLVNKTRTNALLADVGFAVGAALVVTAVIVYPKGSEPRIALAPMPNGAALVGTF